MTADDGSNKMTSLASSARMQAFEICSAEDDEVDVEDVRAGDKEEGYEYNLDDDSASEDSNDDYECTSLVARPSSLDNRPRHHPCHQRCSMQ